MDRSTIITLVGKVYTKDSIGQYVETPTGREVYCDVVSISRSEWYDGGRNGLRPEIAFRVFAPDYHGEDTVEYNGKSYGIYRSYKGRNEIIELYCQRKSGVNS